MGSCCAPAVTPSKSAEPVTRYTSQLMATVCIQFPSSDRPWPAQKILKLFERKARNAGCTEATALGELRV